MDRLVGDLYLMEVLAASWPFRPWLQVSHSLCAAVQGGDRLVVDPHLKEQHELHEAFDPFLADPCCAWRHQTWLPQLRFDWVMRCRGGTSWWWTRT